MTKTMIMTEELTNSYGHVTSIQMVYRTISTTTMMVTEYSISMTSILGIPLQTSQISTAQGILMGYCRRWNATDYSQYVDGLDYVELHALEHPRSRASLRFSTGTLTVMEYQISLIRTMTTTDHQTLRILMTIMMA